MKKVIIIGAGPAGLTAGYELLRKSSDYDVTIVEEASNVGGLCAKIVHNDKVLDAGGHMFISNNSQVKEFWNTILPTQGVPSCDDLFLDRYCKISNGGPDPEKTDEVMLSREKVTRVFNQGKFYESPFRLSKDNFKSFGVGNSIKSGFSQIGGSMFKKKEKSLEEYYVNRYGSKLYDMFLDSYTEKVMGRNPSKISSSFGAVSDRDLITPNISVDKNDGRDLEKATPPFANRFYYPKKGVSQMWETVADRFIEKGGSIHKNCKVLKIHSEDGVVTGITCVADGESFFVACDILISSMPVKDFVNGIDNVPYNVTEVVHGLSYRGLVSIGVELLDMGIKNDTDEQTVNNIIPDAFIYVNEQEIKLGRIQVFNNFSPYMVGKDNHIWLGLNYYCNEGDYYWSMNEQAWKALVVNDLKKIGIIREEGEILDYKKVSFGKAFPSYFDSFERFDEVRSFLDTFENLYCIGRNGQHNFISMEQAMLTSFETVKCILSKSSDKSSIWNASEYISQNDEVKGNYALLTENVEYRGNAAVPLQRYDTLQNEEPREPQKEPISIKRMRRPMMTPIKKAEPVLDENGNVVEGKAVFNDYNLIGAPSFRRAPITVEVTEEEPQIETFDNAYEQNSFDKPFDTLESNASSNMETEVSETKTVEENSNDKKDDVVILKNSVVIAQRPDRLIPIEEPEDESNVQTVSNIVTDYQKNIESVSTVASASAYQSEGSSVISKNSNPYAYLWGPSFATESTNDVHEVVTPEIVPVKVYEEPKVTVEKTEAYSTVESKPAELSFTKVERFEEKEHNIENLRVIQKSGSFENTQTEIFGRVESFEQKDLLEETERVVKSERYNSMNEMADDMFKKADSFQYNALLSESENVIQRPTYDTNSYNNNREQEHIITNDFTFESVSPSESADSIINETSENTVNVSGNENVTDEVNFVENVKDSESEKPKVVTAFSPYSSITSEIDPSIVFKNAKVIKSTKVVKPVETEEIPKETSRSWLDNLSGIGGKEKVIAKFVNGEKIPVTEEVSAPPKKTRTRKTKVKEEETDIVQPPISVVWENKENDSMKNEEAIPTPKKRKRKAKISSETDVNNEQNN